jgi:hypothetical protein
MFVSLSSVASRLRGCPGVYRSIVGIWRTAVTISGTEWLLEVVPARDRGAFGSRDLWIAKDAKRGEAREVWIAKDTKRPKLAKGRQELLAGAARKAWRRLRARRGAIHACPFERFAILRAFRDPRFARFAAFRGSRDPDAVSEATKFVDEPAGYPK